MPKIKDLTGQRFGRLMVIERAEDYVAPNGARSVKWKCQCDCGNETTVTRGSLTNGFTSSCGCYRKETHFNDYYVVDGVAHVKCENGEFLIDEEDIPKVSNKRWYISTHHYAMSSDKKCLHRIVTDCPKGLYVDHINHNTLDNRKNNLRVCTPRQNRLNARPTSNTKEFGICFSNGYYHIQIDGKYCGISKDFAEARQIRDEALKGTEQAQFNYYLQPEQLVD